MAKLKVPGSADDSVETVINGGVVMRSGSGGAIIKSGSDSSALTRPGVLATKLAVTGGGARSLALSSETRGVLDSLREAKNRQLVERRERLADDHPAVEIACDYSASSIVIENSLRQIASGVEAGIRKKSALAKVSFGIYGGGDLVKTRSSAKVLEEEHVATTEGESTFDKYLGEYTGNLDPKRQNILISFHDACTHNSEILSKSIRVLNEKGAIVVIGYIPTSGQDSDLIFLKNLADNETGIRRGIFIDFTGIDFSNPEILQRMIDQIVDAVKISNKKADVASGGDPVVAEVIAQTNLQTLIGGIVADAKKASLSSGSSGRQGFTLSSGDMSGRRLLS